MAITRGSIPDALDANLNEMWQDGLNSWGEEYRKVFNVLNTTKQSEKDSYESGFKPMPEKNEGTPAEMDTIYPGIPKTYIPLTYAMGYEITEEAIEDNEHTPETFNKLPQALNRSAEETVEVVSWNTFNNAFSTNGVDGVPLFSTSHPLLGGGTQSNKPATDADLSWSTLQAGLTAIESFVDERGLKQPTKAVLLVLPVDSWYIGEELLQSEFKPYTANNEVNAIQKKDLQYVIAHYLTDTDAWFLLAEKRLTGLKFWWRVKLGALRKWTDNDTTNLKHLARMRFAVGYSHPKGTYGSSGA